MILRLVKKSLAIECELIDPSGDSIVPSKQAFSKARYKISHIGFQELLEDSLSGTYIPMIPNTGHGVVIELLEQMAPLFVFQTQKI